MRPVWIKLLPLNILLYTSVARQVVSLDKELHSTLPLFTQVYE